MSDRGGSGLLRCAGAARLRIAVLGDIGHLNVQRWCEGLAEAGAEVHALSLAAGSAAGVAVHKLPDRQVGKLNYLAAIPATRSLLAHLRPDVVAAYYVTGYGTLGAWAGYRPLVQMTSGSDILLAPRQAVMRQLVRYNLARAQLVTAWAPHMAEAARRLGVPEARLYVRPRGIPLALFAAKKCRAPSADRPARLICTRSFAPIYQVDALIRAAADLRRRGVSFSLTLAGAGPLDSQLRALVSDLRLSDVVRFPGFIPNDELPGVLEDHDLYVSVAASDGVSASLLEAMATGLLPIVTDIEANRFWIKPGDNGLLIGSATPPSIAAAIGRGIEDLELRQRAWRDNPLQISDRGDSLKNAAHYIARFRVLVGRDRRLGD